MHSFTYMCQNITGHTPSSHLCMQPKLKQKHLFPSKAAVSTGQNSHLLSVNQKLNRLYLDHNTISLIYKWNYKVTQFAKRKKSLHLLKLRKKDPAWEQVSHNDVVLTDVDQLFISLPKSVPSGAQADTMCTCFILGDD